ncbi:MAG TPA: (deoxy)nucleoside triphosphate pyrophosphohydrolase [Candidatus Acidoferrales bacterium]|nr:(deoxy)nucleoside triphosphate pyrophosphohydrolase [Candidatus Acidoferrales bacterium]
MVVVAAIVISDGRVLACQRSRKGKFPLKWEFPGGKVQEGETPRTALERELREELNVGATVGAEIYRARHKYSEMHDEVELIFFAAQLESKMIENQVFENIGWVEPGKLPALDFLEADRGLVNKLARHELRLFASDLAETKSESRETRGRKSASQ